MKLSCFYFTYLLGRSWFHHVTRATAIMLYLLTTLLLHNYSILFYLFMHSITMMFHSYLLTRVLDY